MKNKSFLMTVAISFIAMCSVAQVTGTFTDSRDGKVYKTVTIGKQTWMAENLVCKANSGCWAYDSSATNVTKYGYLYDWETAKKVCPKGWHLPSDAEWTTLMNNLGGKDSAGFKMKTKSGWNGSNNGNNSSNFAGLPGGYRSIFFGRFVSFSDIGDYGFWWSSTENTKIDYVSAWAFVLEKQYGIAYLSSYQMTFGLSVRCIKD